MGIENSVGGGRNRTIRTHCLPSSRWDYRLFWELNFSVWVADTNAAGETNQLVPAA